ncbi:SprT family zinc-dependent metalloprotease [Flavobacterium sp. LHD-85]|uniref:M48 family metallopeptidase n=1 Tax=Flavobacterium sp. LHD-85 TaxID=3071410 RepID=UPI0027E1E0CD|nr:SprT family zinc-dependent metalloprotease [Flavobacterium sp. LHD-85]MDQ6528939.1 SprT family zinc-dependent metalloprotease [Flavobacterium sp. LHD-85]
MKEQIVFGTHTIDFDLKYTNRKSLGIKVQPDTSVTVTAPENAPMAKIKTAVSKKAMWILNQKSYFLSMDTISNDVIIKSGYTVHYLGRQYKVVVEVTSKNEVSYKGNLFLISVTKKEKAQQVFETWFNERAILKITEIAQPIIKKFTLKHSTSVVVFFQDMPTRWGSCTIKNKLILNPKLVHTPKRCIEYVVMHELCHTIHKHHNSDFFNLLTLMMPDWEKRKMKLDTYL